MSYCILNIALCELPKIVEARQTENIIEKDSEITKTFLIKKYNWQKKLY